MVPVKQAHFTIFTQRSPPPPPPPKKKEAHLIMIPFLDVASFLSLAVVWSIGDRCLAQWSGDGKLYTGVIRKLRHAASGCVIALVRFNDYDSDDSEEVDVRQLQRVVKKTDRKRGEKPVGAEGMCWL